jgi:hypothetical protein
MIKLFLSLILILIALPLYANPCMQLVMGGSTGTAAPPAACETQASPTDMVTYGSMAYWVGSASGTRYVSTAFTAGETTPICGMCLYTKSSTGTSPTYSVTAYLYDNNTTPTPDQPDSVIANGTFETKNMTGVLTSDWQWICWYYSGTKPTITDTNIYHAVFYTSGYDGTNIMYAGKDTTCATEITHRAAIDLSWIPVDTDKCMMLKLLKE